MSLIHLSYLNELSEEAKAYTLYFITQNCPDLIGRSDEIFFADCEIPFKDGVAKYKTAIETVYEGLIEYWVIYKNNAAMGVAQRITYDQEFETSFIYFKLQSENDKTIQHEIASLPPVIAEIK
ncbi:hypothetical protein [Photobacterium sanguinicancri]|uniref:SnoaL-like domain-containing protein n=1 Tax=Photobacterium sanguinicancri TaxID=875932 RepID=A0AAW7Y162_9GAMM|nr:hypothetical protein [Photobacterium sanguinicancri]KXI21393.1 hypothetical protein AS132_22750 [Photobacterium sanguinicancri]MDO6542154.1 hypothetical protein [Photobacterium sanguinicancri]